MYTASPLPLNGFMLKLYLQNKQRSAQRVLWCVVSVICAAVIMVKSSSFWVGCDLFGFSSVLVPLASGTPLPRALVTTRILSWS